MKKVASQTFSLKHEQTAALHKAAKKMKLNISEVVREAVDDWLAKVGKKQGE